MVTLLVAKIVQIEHKASQKSEFTCFSAFAYMQLAVKNKVTIPLNTKMTRRNGMETNYIQIIVEMVALFMPVVLLSVLQAVMSDTLSYVFILFVGILFVCTHKLWINNIYKRMMKHKYENLEGFMTSR